LESTSVLSVARQDFALVHRYSLCVWDSQNPHP